MTKDKESFVKVYKWMIDLLLAPNELLVYALIFNMSNSVISWVRCSVTKKYIQQYFNISESTLKRIIKKLKLKKLVFWYHDKDSKIKIYYTSKKYALNLIEQIKQSKQVKLFENETKV